MASLILGNIGSALLGPIGGFIGSAIGSFIDNLLFAPKPEDIEGPRLEDLSGIAADPGVPIPIVFGADRIAGIVVHTTDLIETKHKKKVGGKGGGKRQLQVTYTYHVDIDYMVCEGPILGIGRMWADGKLIRGTRYQMELDTDEYFEQIGGIPYNTWYKDHVYKPEDTPWSYDPTYIGTILPQKYRWDFGVGFTEISDAEAERLLEETKDVVYAYDEGSERYLPIPLSHDYTGEIYDPEGTGGGGGGGGGGEGPGSSFDLNGFGVTTAEDGLTKVSNQSINALGTWVGDETPIIGTFSGSINLADYENTSLGGDFAWSVTMSISITVYAYDQNGNPVSVPGGTGSAQIVGNTKEGGSVSVSALIFEGAAYAEITTIASRASPALSDATVRSTTSYGWGAGFGEYLPPPPYRDWPDYYNFYDAINDWSPKAVLEFHGPEGVAFYPGTSDQIQDPTMQLVVPGQGEAIIADPDDPDAEDDLEVPGFGEVPAYRCRAHIVFQRFELEDYGNRIPNLTFEVVQSDDARIRPAIVDLMNRAGVDPEYYDITALPEQGIRSYMLGYSIGKATNFRAAMEPLLESFKVDAAEIGNKLVFRPKAREYDYIIDYMDLSTVDVGSGPEAPIRLTFRDVIEMPKALAVRYKDPEREYQVNTAIFHRQIGRSIQTSSMELPAVLAPSIMKEFVRDKMRDLWLERSSGAWTLPHKYSYISPTDLCLINGSQYNEEDSVFKVTKVTRRDTGILEMEGVLRETLLYIPVEGETSDLAPSRGIYETQTVTLPALTTVGKLLNLPALLESHSDAGYYWAASGSKSNWGGASLHRNEALPALPIWDVIDTVTTGAKIGTTRYSTLQPLDDWAGIDRTSVIEVDLINPNDELESVTGYELLAGKNAALIGSEIVMFKDAVRIGTRRWRLRNFLRGRRGTEWAVKTHEWVEDFVFLGPDEIKDRKEELSTVAADLPSEIDPRQFKFVTFGTTLGDQTVLSFANTGERLRPFAPAQVRARKEVNDDITFAWTRQDRMVFDMTGSGEIPMSEDTETYLIYVGVVDAYDETPVRQIQVTSTETATYTAAQQIEDGLEDTGFSFAIFQMSDTVGRGIGAVGVYNAS